MPKRRSRTVTSTIVHPAHEPSGLLADAQTSASALGELLRRVALGLCAALIVSRAYFPAEFRSETDSGSALSWSLAMIAAALIASLGAWLSGGLRLRWSWSDLGVIALFVLVALSARHAADRRIAINLAWEWLGVGLAYILLRSLPRTRGETSVLAAALVATATAVAAYGLFQIAFELPRLRALFETNPREALARAGLDPDMSGPSLKRFHDRLVGSREPISTFSLTNTLAGVIVGPLVAALAILVRPIRPDPDEAPGRPGAWATRLAAVLVALVMMVCLLLTKSRSAQLGLIVAMAVLAVRERRRVPARTIALASAAGVAGLVVMALVAWKFWQFDHKVITEAPRSFRFRLDYWRGAWGVISDDPGRWFSGVGPGNFAGPYLRHKAPTASEEISDPHSALLDVWVIGGLPALLAMLAGLAIGLREVFGPDRRDRIDVDSPDDEAPPPRSSTWLAVSAGLGGLVAIVALGKINPVADEGIVRWLVLGISWGLSAALIYPLWSRSAIPADALGLGVVAISVNLLAAGGIGFAPVSLMLWGLLALGMDRRWSRRCEVRRPVDGRGLAFAACAASSALIGTFFGTTLPFWRAESSILDAEAALVGAIANPSRADRLYQRAADDDALGSSARIARANLEMLEWRRRGRPTDDLAWHRINSGLKSAAEPPRDPDNLLVQRLRAQWALEFLSRSGFEKAERNTIRNDRLDACRRACELYPTDATLRADFAFALAEIGNYREAVRQASRSLEQDATTPHADKKLDDAARETLLRKAAKWTFATM